MSDKKEIKIENLNEVSGGGTVQTEKGNKCTIFICHATCGHTAYVLGNHLHTTRTCPKCGNFTFTGERLVNEEDVPSGGINPYF